jgi:hypothetical protein
MGFGSPYQGGAAGDRGHCCPSSREITPAQAGPSGQFLVPGRGQIPVTGFAHIFSVSCAKAGDCSAGGFYQDASRHLQAFVAGELNGVWGTAQQVPGTAALNKGGGRDHLGVVR